MSQLTTLNSKSGKVIGRPIGTTKRQISSGVSHDRINAIRSAILRMDASDNRLWSMLGHPRTAYLQKVTGFPDIARWEIGIACPGIRKESAHHYSIDTEHLTLAKGRWRLQMKRDGVHLRKHLKTADLNLAVQIRDWYCIGGWDLVAKMHEQEAV